MELSHFSALNHLARFKQERTPAQLARAFHVSQGAKTKTLGKLEVAVGEPGAERVRAALPILRELRLKLEQEG